MFTELPGSSSRCFTPWPATDAAKGRPLGELLQEILDDMVNDRRITQVCCQKGSGEVLEAATRWCEVDTSLVWL